MMKDKRIAIRRVFAGSSAIALTLGLAAPAFAEDGATPPVTDAAAVVASAAMAAAPQAAPVQDTVGAEDEDARDIVVTGFRSSLQQALSLKRESVSAVDAIVAEDIAKFPDQNLAESLQRIPGISIQRDGGEGRAITVRGLGAQFTRVRVNGLETVATSTDGASSNRDRAFDFNVFASELFSSIVVHKTAEASLDEGSLGAVVDLNTGNPLAGKEGLTFVGSAQGSYNTLSKDLGPRLAGLLGWKSPDGTLGVAISAAYQDTDTLELGNNSVRWAQAPFKSVKGTPCYGGDGKYVSSAGCDEVALAFHPRIPRYGEVRHARERLGVTGSVQWAPTDATKVSLDALYSKFKETREEKWGEVLFRSNEKTIDVVDYTIDGNNNLISGTFDNAWVRTEHYLRKSQTEFYQVGATWDQDLTDSFRFTAVGGFSKSDATIPVETTLIFDDRDATGYQYDYSDMWSPRLTFGTSVSDPANFQLAEIRDRPSSVVNTFQTAQLRTEWDVAEGFTLKTGAMYRRFKYDIEGFTRDTVVCPSKGGPDSVLGTITCTPSSYNGPDAVYGFQATDALAESFTLGKAGQPSGTTETWLIPNLEAGTAFTKLYDRALAIDAGNTRGVVEKVTGGYMQVDIKGDLFGLDYAANAGMRYAHTAQRSRGLSSGTEVSVSRTYDDWLPAMNVSLFPAHNIILRGAIAKVMTRPSLGNLTPGGSIDGFNYNISFGNPNLKPYRATNFDIGVEWYFAPESVFSVAVFRKEIESFPVADTRSGTFASTGLPTSIITPSSPAAQDPEGREWTIKSMINGEGATLEGVEIGVQAPFTFLPGILSNFGFIGNATFIRSSADYNVSGPAKVPGGALVSEPRSTTLFGVSKRAFNGTLYYEDGKFSARGSVSYREGFIDANSATGNVFEGYNDAVNVDASLRYKITPQLELSLQGVNLTDDYRQRWTDVDAQRNYENNHFGRTILIGARFSL
ncbi:TonB-dependent receptor [Hephaestia sp. MAHUQ-44]|uniref:TonB-dependent receptor n=2 Tax=unclassified Hephaestia TaxID=2631281 RepID=UPI0020778BFA|nr:TonB-dependent receptor [Hephaestia sp. MAHUQ-44]MCM8731676.1 TonB-dependent receptor [Hephaestia sp. MAHUQ-44]